MVFFQRPTSGRKLRRRPWVWGDLSVVGTGPANQVNYQLFDKNEVPLQGRDEQKRCRCDDDLKNVRKMWKVENGNFFFEICFFFKYPFELQEIHWCRTFAIKLEQETFVVCVCVMLPFPG